MQPHRHLIIHEAMEGDLAAALCAALQERGGDGAAVVGFIDPIASCGTFNTSLDRHPAAAPNDALADESARLGRMIGRLQFVLSLLAHEAVRM